jgi:hypothetical protein
MRRPKTPFALSTIASNVHEKLQAMPIYQIGPFSAFCFTGRFAAYDILCMEVRTWTESQLAVVASRMIL